jgi:hypothetical protein
MPRTHNATGRARKSTGDINTAPDVANTVRKRSKIPDLQWTWHSRAMREAPAFRVLSLSARRVLDRIELELMYHGGKDNGKLPCTFDDFEKYGVHRHSIAPAIRELEALGFIRITRRGRAGNSEFRQPHLFRITHKPAGSDPATDEWRLIKTTEEAEMIQRRSRIPPKTPARKQKSSGEKRTMASGGNRTTEPAFHSAETTTTGSVRKPPLLSISWPQGPMQQYHGQGSRKYVLSSDPRAFQEYATITPSSLRFEIGRKSARQQMAA